MPATAALVVAFSLASATLSRAACTISATSVAFGAYNVFNTGAVDSTGTVSFTCDKKSKNIQIALDRGGAGTFSRTLRSGAEQLAYNLYLDATRSVIWGDGTGGTVVYQNANPPDNQQVNVPVYGRIPGGQDAAVGSYNDSVVATIIF